MLLAKKNYYVYAPGPIRFIPNFFHPARREGVTIGDHQAALNRPSWTFGACKRANSSVKQIRVEYTTSFRLYYYIPR